MPAALQLTDEPVRAGQETEPDSQPLVLGIMDLSNTVADGLLDRVPGNVRDELLAAHPDSAVQGVLGTATPTSWKARDQARVCS